MAKKSQQASTANVLLQPQPQQISPAQAVALAGEQIEAGQLQSAEGLLRRVLQRQPRNAFALHLMGVIAHRAGRAELAIELIGKAIEIQPNVAQFHSNRGEMLRILKRLDEAIYHGERAVSLDPGHAVARSNLGIAYYDKKDYERAAACQEKALELNPKLLQALNNLGSIRRELKDKEGAIAYYRQALEISPDYLEARNNLGAVLTELEKPEEAMAELVRVVHARPQYADAHCNIGNAFLQMENYDKAIAAFNQTLALMPDNPGAIMGLARACKELNRLDEAHATVNRALQLAPDKAEAYSLAGDIYTKMEQYEKAETAFRKALELDENLLSGYLGLGQLQMELGQFDASQANFQKAMEIDPKEIAPHVHMAQAREIKPDDPLLERLEAEAEHFGTMPATRALALHFALGKAYDDLKEYDKAFPHFAEGCRLKRARIQYDADNFDLACKNIREFFTREKIAELRGGGDPSDVPIFVLGMPRSGTTLTETILASHPDVYGAGELHDLLAIANQPIPGKKTEGFPLSMRGVTRDDLTRAGARYVAGLRERNATAKHITDKMPANFLAVGLIHLMLPNAKIVHIKRNAADICLSCFTKLFNNSQYHTYDLSELGRYYVNYARLMEHWSNVLPEGAFLDVQYEDLVANKEAQTRRLIEYCGLEWNDACLESHKTERSIKTASISQVRQPVYTSSVERWRRYEKHLQPLLEVLGEYAPT
jgi:tetratricopeptide (TPR) repeat protein